LVSRLWMQPARRALGRRLVLIIDAKRLPRIPLALESPLYGPWTTHIEILEVPYTSTRDKGLVNEVWASVQGVLRRLENIRSFTINSRILWSSAVRLPWLLPRLKNLQELHVINTGIVVTSDSLDLFQKIANVTSQMPFFRKVTLQRCLPVGDSSYDVETSTSQDLADFAHKLHAIKSSIFSSFSCWFMAKSVSFVFDREEMQWSADEVTVTYMCGSCSKGCNYCDPSGACANVRYLRLTLFTNPFSISCTANLLRNFTNAAIVHLTLGSLPAQEIIDALSCRLEEVILEVMPRLELCELEEFDERLSRFCAARRSKLRQVTVSLGEDEDEQRNHVQLFPLTRALCKMHAMDFLVSCD